MLREPYPKGLPELVKPAQAAKTLGISRRCLTNWTRDRVVPSISIGRVRLYDMAKVHTAIEKFEQVEVTR